MHVSMAVRLAGRIIQPMRMPVVDVVHVPVLVVETLMQVLVFVRLGEMQVDADSHEQRGTQQGKARRLAKQRQREGRANKGGG